jgi:short subunit dehydrogenase-like uncharacterized protein
VRRRVGLLGATGYTGRLVAAELDARGIDARLGARSPARIDEEPAGERVAVDVTDRRSLLAFLDGVDVVINTVGPFRDLGMPVVAAAVERGVAYVDSTGEPPFITEAFRAFRTAQVPVVPACGFDYLPGDLAAAVAAEHLGGPCRSVEVHYDVVLVPTGGTARSASAVFDGADLGEPRPVRFPDGVRWVVDVPFGERVLVPRHVPGATVTVTTTVPKHGAALMGAVVRVLPRLAPVVERIPDAIRRRGRFTILVVATGDDGERSVVAVVGHDVYGLTARLLVMASQAVEGRGAMAPAEALDPDRFLDAARGDGFEWAFAFPEGPLAPE